MSRLLRPITEKDGTGLTSIIPTGGRFRFYSVVNFNLHRTREEYRLEVGGQVKNKLSLSYADLTAMPSVRLVKDFQCVTGWRVPQVKWKGVRLADVIARAAPQAAATAVEIESFDGAYTETLTLDQARRNDVIVAYSMEGEALSTAHGGPVRLYVAPMYGYKSCKWLEAIEVVDGRPQPGYWEVRGYDVDAFVGKSNGRDDNPTG